MNPSPPNVYKRGGGLGGCLGLGWVGASNPPYPPPPFNRSLPTMRTWYAQATAFSKLQ